MPVHTDEVRIGVLGAARITPASLIRPARDNVRAAVVTVAARDRDHAERFARRHDVPTVHDSYQALLDDPAVDAV
ncbi:MAG: gfo/Idh/MocA family oxidoreductase, partial [Pseudonocardiaceae bacterium]|nr:gfo/Idh/MocA family oxidoreductase [Pseudonocardiaceae bacterium]